MNIEDLKNIAQNIVAQADELKRQIVDKPAPVNYTCIFCQTEDEYSSLLELAGQMGKIVHDTNAGPVFKIEPLPTVAGDLLLLKIRKPDPNRPERGDADFTLTNYEEFKKGHLGKDGYQLIDKSDFEMIEYKAPNAKVLVYFSNPTLGEVLGVT